MKKLFILTGVIIFCFNVIGTQAFEIKDGVNILKLAHVNPVGSLTPRICVSL